MKIVLFVNNFDYYENFPPMILFLHMIFGKVESFFWVEILNLMNPLVLYEISVTLESFTGCDILSVFDSLSFLLKFLLQ